MIVAGGTYLETVVQPPARDLVGSGVRAAAALTNASKDVSLITAVDEATAPEADRVAATLESRERFFRGANRLGFNYMTPISSPSINGLSAEASGRIQSNDSTTLLFGFVERGVLRRNFDSETVVLDPQKPRDTDPLSLSGIKRKRLVVVANRSETLQLGGRRQGLKQPPASCLIQQGKRSHQQARGRGLSGHLVRQDRRPSGVGRRIRDASRLAYR